MDTKNEFYFELSLTFESDAPVEKLEKLIGLKPQKIVKLSESKGPIKTAKFFYKTDTFKSFYTDKLFKEFLLSLKDNFKALPEILREWKGECYFYIVFTKMLDKPYLSLDSETIKLLAFLNANYDIDFNY